MKAAECEKRAIAAANPDHRQTYAELAKQWWSIARDIEHLERQMAGLEADKNSN